MAKNEMLRRMEQKIARDYELLFRAKMEFVAQMCMDAAMIAANETPSIRMGPGRAKEFAARYIDEVNSMSGLLSADGKDDADLVYSRAKIDEKLRRIVGADRFIPWEERYRREL